jgi:hypothetical protein
LGSQRLRVSNASRDHTRRHRPRVDDASNPSNESKQISPILDVAGRTSVPPQRWRGWLVRCRRRGRADLVRSAR